MSAPDAWYVSSVLAGMGRDPRAFVYYVQRYTPYDGRRYTGDVAQRTWSDEAEAEAAAEAANAGRVTFSFRGTYL